MTLLIRWDAADAVYISGGPGERYVHFPLELSSTIPTDASVTVSAFSGDTMIVSRTFEGIGLTANWVKFSPAILIPDAAQITLLKALIYTTTVPVTQPRLVTKSLGGIGDNYTKYLLGGALLFVALNMFKRRRK
jgi:hypothetical protein